jgi:hypothetical protein
LKATSYLMLPYGFYAIPGFLFLPLGAAGLWSSTEPGSVERFALTAYTLSWLLISVLVGATSSYWGMDIMPLAVLGTALLLANADTIALAIAARRSTS